MESSLKHALNKALDFINGRIANNGKFAAIDQAVISVANFLASILLAALVSPTELGVYVLGFLAIYFVRAVQNGIIVQPLNTYGAAKTEEEFKPYFSAIALQQMILSIMTALTAAIIGWILIQTGNDTLGPTIFVLWFSFFTWQLQELMRRAFYTRGEVHKAMWVSTCANLIRLGLILILASLRSISGITGLNAIGWGSLGGTILGLWLGRDYFTSKLQQPFSIWRENWQFGRWILGASVADWVVVDLYPIFMAGMISFAATGVYQALQNLVAPIHVLLRAVDTFATPILAKLFDQSGLDKINQALKRIYLLAAVPVVGLLILVLLFTPQLLTLLRGETYLAYADAIYIMVVFYLFLFINRPLQMAFRAIRQGKQIFWANVLAAISMFTIGFLLINRWGIYGGIGGQALNAFIISVVLLIAWIRQNRAKAPNASGIIS
jgi:O-antigen/teichoic acid export membrane protein